MNKIKTLLAAALLSLVILPAHAGVKEIGTVNGLRIVRIKSAGLFAPSTTTIIAYDPSKPGTIEGVLNGTGGPGFVPAVATAGGIVGGAALLRPSKTKVVNEGGNANSHSSSNSGASATGGSVNSGPTTVNSGHVHNNSH